MTPVECYRGTASRTAWLLYQEFKDVYISPMQEDGGIIHAYVVKNFMEGHREVIKESYDFYRLQEGSFKRFWDETKGDNL